MLSIFVSEMKTFGDHDSALLLVLGVAFDFSGSAGSFVEEKAGLTFISNEPSIDSKLSFDEIGPDIPPEAEFFSEGILFYDFSCF